MRFSFRFFFTLFFILSFSLPGFGQEEDSDLDELQKNRQALSSLAKEIAKTKDISPQTHGIDFRPETLLDPVVVKSLQKQFQQGPWQSLSKKELSNLLLERSQGSFINGIYLSYPKVLEFMVELIQDREALSQLLGVFLRKNDLSIFGLVCFGIVILSWLLKKILYHPRWPWWLPLILGIGVGVLSTLSMMMCFYRMFRAEVSPAVEIASRIFF